MTGIPNEEGSGARLHAPAPEEMTGRRKGACSLAKTAFAFTQTHGHTLQIHMHAAHLGPQTGAGHNNSNTCTI